MDGLKFLATIFQDLLIFVGAMFVLLVIVLFVVSRLPAENPLRQILSSLSLRIGAMLGAGLLALPIEPIPGLDVAYDVGASAAVICFWITFFRKAAEIMKGSRGALPPSDPRSATDRKAFEQRDRR